MLDAHVHLLLTFDDGGKSALVAADLLEKRGWRGHFFVITSFIDTPGFVAKSDVRELHARGHLIGSHSHTHPDVFRAISYSRMQYEWTYSRECLADILGEPVAAAAIPGGHGNYLTERAAASAGYRFLFTSIPRKVPWITDCMLCIGRVCAKKGTPMTRISALAHGRGFTQQMCVWRMKSAARALCSSVSLVTADQGPALNDVVRLRLYNSGSRACHLGSAQSVCPCPECLMSPQSTRRKPGRICSRNQDSGSITASPRQARE